MWADFLRLILPGTASSSVEQPRLFGLHSFLKGKRKVLDMLNFT